MAEKIKNFRLTPEDLSSVQYERVKATSYYQVKAAEEETVANIVRDGYEKVSEAINYLRRLLP
jgi:hypothetical protein